MLKTLLLANLLFVHSWYEPACCSGQDCHPVADSAIRKVEKGYMVEGLFYPDARVRPSKDSQYHACFDQKTKQVFCLYVPLAA